MFKDYNKYLSASLKVYIFVLLFVFILKLVGMDYFALAIDNPTMIKINNFVAQFKIREIWYIFTLWLYAYIIISIVTNNKGLKSIIVAIIITIIDVACILTIKYKMNQFLMWLFDFSLLYIGCIVVSHNNIKRTTKRTVIWLMINTLFQCISMITRKGNIQIDQNDFITMFILNFDYILLMIISFKLNFTEGGTKLCGMAEVGLSLLKKIHLRKSLKQLQRNLHKFKQLPKQERLSISIYIFLSLLWNTLSLVIILLVANLNHTFIECLFILTSFWLSKHAFGKPFHLPSMIQCFIISNLTYYTLNRITTPLGISIFIPILLGVGLSYVTSKLVKKTYKKLYKGMPKELFDETILKIVDKDSVKYKICYGFYINKKSDLALSFEYNYSIAGIRKIKDRINDKIKELN